MNEVKVTTLLMLAIILVTGILIYRSFGKLDKNPESLDPNSKEWCLEEGGRPVFVGYSNSWNCEFKKEGE